jgi:hypothetical protein
MSLVSQGRHKRQEEAGRKKSEAALEENVMGIQAEFDVGVR